MKESLFQIKVCEKNYLGGFNLLLNHLKKLLTHENSKSWLALGASFFRVTAHEEAAAQRHSC